MSLKAIRVTALRIVSFINIYEYTPMLLTYVCDLSLERPNDKTNLIWLLLNIDYTNNNDGVHLSSQAALSIEDAQQNLIPQDNPVRLTNASIHQSSFQVATVLGPDKDALAALCGPSKRVMALTVHWTIAVNLLVITAARIDAGTVMSSSCNGYIALSVSDLNYQAFNRKGPDHLTLCGH